MKTKRKIIRIDEDLCHGCGECVPSCAEGAIQVVDGKATIMAEKYCDGLGACLGECPRGALSIDEREADEFDAEAVERHLASREEKAAEGEAMPCGCPSTLIQTLRPMGSGGGAQGVPLQGRGESSLSHWPVQIRLVPASAPFLKNADLLVAADCTALAYPDFHRDFLMGKAVMIGCPKFDDVKGYIDKFAEVFRAANIRSVMVLDMEVPCCSALPLIVKKGMEAAGKKVPLEEVVISSRGEILRRERLAA